MICSRKSEMLGRGFSSMLTMGLGISARLTNKSGVSALSVFELAEDIELRAGQPPSLIDNKTAVSYLVRADVMSLVMFTKRSEMELQSGRTYSEGCQVKANGTSLEASEMS